MICVRVQCEDVRRVAAANCHVVGDGEPEVRLRFDELDLGKLGTDHLGGPVAGAVLDQPNRGLAFACMRPDRKQALPHEIA